MLLSYTSIIISQNNLIHIFYKMVTTHYTLLTYLLTNTLDTRDPIGSKKTYIILTINTKIIIPLRLIKDSIFLEDF